MKLYLATLVMAALLAGCADGKKDYEAVAKCQGMGLSSGTAAYDQCIKQERLGKLMEQQRRDYEENKQIEQDWKMRRY